MSASSELAASSLKDLLKICRSHLLTLPDPLPKDKQYYVDLIVRHRAALRGGEYYAPEDLPAAASSAAVHEGESYADAVQMSVAASAAAGARYAAAQGREGFGSFSGRGSRSSSIDHVGVDEAAAPSFAHVAVRARRGAMHASAAPLAAIPLPIALPVASAAAAASSASSSSSAASSSVLSPDPEYDDGDDDAADDDEGVAEFTRSPAVQKIMAILSNIAVFDWLERHTGVGRFWWLVLLIALACFGVFWSVGVLAVCNFVCFVYPAYQTFKTLEGKYLAPIAPVAAQTPEVARERASSALYQQQQTPPPSSPSPSPAPSSSSSRRSLGPMDSLHYRPLPASLSDDRSIEVHSYWLSYWCVYGLFRLLEFGTDLTLYWLPYYEPLKVLFLVWSFHPATQGCSLAYRWVISPLFLPREAAIDRAIERLADSSAQAAREVKAIILKKVAKRIAGTDGDTPRKPEFNERYDGRKQR
jgi:hypothetical protein